jgi:hypothetical protein
VRYAVGWAVAALFLFSLAYLCLWALGTIAVNGATGRIPTGFSVNDAGRRQLEVARENPELEITSVADLVATAHKNDPDRDLNDVVLGYYEPLGVYATRIGLLALWAGAIVSVAWTLTSFTLYHRRRPARAGRGAPGLSPEPSSAEENHKS